jgi:uncharacterized protein with GYD domain
MSAYWVTLAYTAGSWHALVRAGAEQRRADVIGVLGELGIELDEMWWELERHALHLVVHAEDRVAVSALSVFDLAAGIVESVEVRTLLGVSEISRALKKAEDLEARLEANPR